MSGMNFKKTLLVLLLTLTLLFTLAVPTFAEDVTTEAEITSGEANSEEVTTEASDETTAAGTTATTTDGATTTKGSSTTTSSTTTAAGDEGWGVGDWVSLAIGVVIIAVLLVLAILFITVKDDGTAGKDGGKVPFRIRGKRFFRSTKSEASKVVWTPWKTVRKNTLVVIIVMIACALLIGLLDWVLSEGIVALAGLF